MRRVASIISACLLAGVAHADPPRSISASFLQPGLMEMPATDTLPDGAMLFFDPADRAKAEIQVMAGDEIGASKDDVLVIESFAAKASIAGKGFAIDAGVWIVIGTLDRPGDLPDEVDVRILLQDDAKQDPVDQEQREKICGLARSICEAIADMLYSKESRECERKYAGDDAKTRRIREQCIQAAVRRFHDRRFNCGSLYDRCMGDPGATPGDVEPPFNPDEPRHRCERERQECEAAMDAMLDIYINACDRAFGPIAPNNPCLRGRMRCSDWVADWTAYHLGMCDLMRAICMNVAPGNMPNVPPMPPMNPPRRRMGDCIGDNLAGIKPVDPGVVTTLRANLDNVATIEKSTNTVQK